MIRRMEQKQQKPYPLRMPDDMREALEQAAANGGRSLHAELLGRLATTLNEEQTGEDVDRTKKTLLKVRMDLEHALKNLEIAEHRAFLRGEREKARAESAPELSPLEVFERDRIGLLNGFSRTLSEIDALDAVFKMLDDDMIPTPARMLRDRLSSHSARFKRELAQIERVIATHKLQMEGPDIVVDPPDVPAPVVKRTKRAKK